ncbi:PKD domain-containing protein [Flavobacterium rakeshii]|uniref:PKD domain-containing protein n=1 Tax=Flavobacterium rakeshii TaxID=1038845 RepID=UPI002E7AD1D4|nr:PKD domain-containing protein [Flavobacterium rakeshii]MEE1899155.1 PKD domain-containing protein [Flavobacterium rakeshii]
MRNFLWPLKTRHILAFAIFFIAFTHTVNAQEAISILWDKETGCVVYDEKKREYVEDINDGPCVRVCENSTVTYSLTGNSANWNNTQWNVGGGTIQSQSLTECVVDWGTSGAATVSAEVTKNDGTVQVEEICVEIIVSPKALFTVEPYSPGQTVEACIGQDLYFTNLSDNMGGSELISYFWEFGDNTTSTEFEPVHAYQHDGLHKVYLTVTNACNCTSTFEIKVNVDKFPGVEIVCPGVVCDGGTATYSVSNEVGELCANVGFNWHVDGGHIVSQPPYGPSIDVVWDNVDETGFGYVSFDATGCEIKCAGVTTIKVPVMLSNGTILGDSTICIGEQNIYKLPQWPSTNFNWTLSSNGTGASLVNTPLSNEVVVSAPSSPGTIILSATYNNTLLNCGGTAEIQITVKPKAVITGDTTLCVNSSETYQLSNGYTGSWTLTGPGGTQTGSGNTFTKTFTQAGNYTLKVNGSTFCKPSQVSIVVRDQEQMPASITGPSTACPGIAETYSVSNNISGTIITWEVTGGTINGSDTGNSINVTFTGAGPYEVRARRENSTDPNCPSDYVIKTVTAPVVNAPISGDNVVCGSSYATYQTSYTDGEFYSWSINPANRGSVSTGNGTNQVEILWNQESATGVELKLVVTKCGIQHEEFFYVDIVQTPPVSLVNPVTSICAGDNFSLTLTGVTTGTVTCDFGDGSTPYTNANPLAPIQHSYDNVNSLNTDYTVHITISDPNGCPMPAEIWHTITVIPAPVATITPGGNYSVCPESAIDDILTVNIQGGFASATSVVWYHNGNIITSGVPSIDLGALGLGYGQYHAEVSNGYCTTITNKVNYNGNCNPNPCIITPEPTVTVLGTNNCGVISATASASGSPTGYQWFSQPAALSVSSPTATSAQFTFAESGTYRIYYRAIYGNCIVDKYDDVLVPYMPDLRYNITCGSGGNYNVTLLDHSNYHPLTPIQNYTYTVDGTAITNNQNSYTVSLAPGNHTLQLTIQGSGHPSCSTSPITINLPDMPDATFTIPTQICEGTPFELELDNPLQTGLSYIWYFADGSTNLQPNPTKVYAAAGNYDTKIKITNQYGCEAIYYHPITHVMQNQLDGIIVANPPVACEGSTSTLTFSSTSPILPTNYEWMKGNQVIGTTTTNTFNVTQPGSYWVRISGDYDCYKEIGLDSPVTVTFVEPTPAHISGPSEICYNEGFGLSSPEGPAGTLYTWTKNGNVVGSTNSITDYASAITTYTYSLTVQTPNGAGGYCTTTDTHTVTVRPLPSTPSITIANVDCDPYSIKLVATAGETGTFNWSNGEYASNTSSDVITVHQGGAYQVRFTNQYGCSSTTQIDVPKDPAIYLWNVPAGCYSLCDLETSYLQGTSPYSFPAWQWLHNGSVINSGSNSPAANQYVANPGAGTYQLVLNNGYCDRVSNEVNIDKEKCSECKFEIRIKDLKPVYDHGYCYYNILFDINNTYGMPVQTTLTLPGNEGIFVPSSLTLNPGPAVYPVQMIPLNGFSGGYVTVMFETVVEGKTCRFKMGLELPGCKAGRPAQDSDTDTNSLAEVTGYDLVIAPNPAKENVAMNYSYAFADSEKTIQVYNLLGVLIETYTPKEQKGTWNFNLGRLSAGQYIVVMKEDGNMLMQKNLIIH